MCLILPHGVIGSREALKQVLLRDSAVATIAWGLINVKG